MTDHGRSSRRARCTESSSPRRRALPFRTGLDYRCEESYDETSAFRVIREPHALRTEQDYNNEPDLTREYSPVDPSFAGPSRITTRTVTNSTHISDPAYTNTNKTHTTTIPPHTTTEPAHISMNPAHIQSGTMPSDISKMPTPGSKRSPSWEGDAKELNKFFEDFEELAEGASLSGEEKVKWVLKYLGRKKDVKFWKTRDGYKDGDWAVFKAAVITQYPGAKDGHAYSAKDLEKVVKAFAKKKDMDEEDLINYYSRFCPIAGYLIEKQKISSLERDRGFWSGLPKGLRAELKLRFDMANGNRDRTVIPAMDDVMKVARASLAEDALDLEKKKSRKKKKNRRKKRKESDSDSDSDSGSDSDSSSDVSSDTEDSSDGSDSSCSGKEKRRKKKGKDKLKRKGGVKKKKVTFEGRQTRGEEIEDLTRQLPKLNVHEAGYATAYVRLQILAPEIAAMLPKPGCSSGGCNHNSVQSNTFQNSATVTGPARPQAPRPFACYFCDDPSHRMRDCLLVIEYIKVGRVAWKDGRLVFSGLDAEAIWYNPRGLRVEVDKRYGSSVNLSRNLGEPHREPFKREPVPHIIPTATTSFIHAEGTTMAMIVDEKVEEEKVANDEEDAEEEQEFWMGFEELIGSSTFATTRSAAKAKEKETLVSKPEASLKKDNMPKAKQPDKAYTYESHAADPDAPGKLYDRLMMMEVPNVTLGDLVSISGELRKTVVETLRTTRVPTADTSLLVQKTPLASTFSVGSISLDYCTALREVEVKLAGGIVDVGLMDEGSEIVVVRKDLWEATCHSANPNRRMMMQAANGGTQVLKECAEFLELEVGGIKTWAHAYVVPFAPFKLLLGRPWQKSVLLQKTEHEDGRVTVVVHNPANRSEKRVIETRERRWRKGMKEGLMFRRVEDVEKAWRLWREEQMTGEVLPVANTTSFVRAEQEGVSEPDLASDLYPTSLVNFFLADTFEYDIGKHALAYKRVANKIRPVPTTMPDYAKVRRSFPEDPLLTLPKVDPHPKDFVPGLRLTTERLEGIGVMANSFLWEEERKLAAAVLLVNEKAIAWCEQEKGRFRDDYFSPVIFPVIEHIPWCKKNRPTPPAVREKMAHLVRKKVEAGVPKVPIVMRSCTSTRRTATYASSTTWAHLTR